MESLRALAHALTHPSGLPGCADNFGAVTTMFMFRLDRTQGATPISASLHRHTAHETLLYQRDEACIASALTPLLSPLQEADILWAVDPEGDRPQKTAPYLEISRSVRGLHGIRILGISDGGLVIGPFAACPIHHRFEMNISRDIYPQWRVEQWLYSLLIPKPPFALYPVHNGQRQAQACAFAPAGLSEAPWGSQTPYTVWL